MAAKTEAPDSGAVTSGPEAIFTALRSIGANAVQAAGVMGNWIAESDLNPEASVTDSNGYKSYGLAQWNSAPGNYPGAAGLVTGNPAKDIVTQVKYFAQTGGLRAATGSTPSEVAANVAQNYERCSTCQPGGTSFQERQANAVQVAGWAATNSWPDTASQAADQATLTSAQEVAAGSGCAWKLPEIDLFVTHIGGQCLLSTSQLRAIIASLMLVAGSGWLLVGGLVLFAVSAPGHAAGRAAGTALEGVGLGALAAGQPELAAPLAVAGSRIRKASGGKRSGAASRTSKARAASRSERDELRAKGASDIRTARKPAGSLGKPTVPGRKTGTYTPSAEPVPF